MGSTCCSPTPTRSDLGNADGNVAGYIQDAHEPQLEYGPVAPDLRHRFTASYLYQFPVGRGRTFASVSDALFDAVYRGLGCGGNHHCANRPVGNLDRIQRSEQYR